MSKNPRHAMGPRDWAIAVALIAVIFAVPIAWNWEYIQKDQQEKQRRVSELSQHQAALVHWVNFQGGDREEAKRVWLAHRDRLGLTKADYALPHALRDPSEPLLDQAKKLPIEATRKLRRAWRDFVVATEP